MHFCDRNKHAEITDVSLTLHGIQYVILLYFIRWVNQFSGDILLLSYTRARAARSEAEGGYIEKGTQSLSERVPKVTNIRTHSGAKRVLEEVNPTNLSLLSQSNFSSDCETDASCCPDTCSHGTLLLRINKSIGSRCRSSPTPVPFL